MLMSTDWKAFGGQPTDVIKGGCGISGLYDLEPIRLSYLNEVLRLTQESAIARCSVRHRARVRSCSRSAGARDPSITVRPRSWPPCGGAAACPVR
jgi:hypothetical protein